MTIYSHSREKRQDRPAVNLDICPEKEYREEKIMSFVISYMAEAKKG